MISVFPAKGDFPKRALRLVLEWLDLHRDELLEDWDLVQAGIPRRKSHPWSKVMTPKVTEAQYAKEFTFHVRFSDGTEGDVDLSQELYGELFEPLRETAAFKSFTIHPEFHTLCWPNGADLAPEFLHEKALIPA